MESRLLDQCRSLYPTALLLITSYCHIGISLAQTDNTATNPPGQEFNFPWYIWLVIALSFSVAVIITGGSAVCILYSCRRCYKRRSRAERSVMPPQILMSKDEVDAFQADMIDDWELARKQIKLVKQLGIGEYGPIYDAEIKLKTNISSRALVKVFQQGTSQDLVKFREDVDDLISFSHPNISKLLGLVSQRPYYIVLELTVNGDLKSFLLATSASRLAQNESRVQLGQLGITTAQRIAMATDAASGLAYLEGMDYVHRDVAARNCMVTQSLGVKIGDYKVGRYLFRSEYAVQADGSLMPLRWMAPESILSNVFTTQSSVWSMGVLLWEVMAEGSFPYSELSDSTVIGRVCYEGHKLPHTPDCPKLIYSLMERCWHSDPNQRPHPSGVYKTLESSILTNRYKYAENTGEEQLFY